MKIKKINNIITIVIIILILILFFLVFGILNELKKEVNETVTLEIIENYNYKLTDSDTNYYKSVFKELKNVLKDEIDKEAYVSIISKLFVIDFYSLKSAINKNDVGGVQFIKEEYQEKFIKIAKDSIYSNIENNIYGDRTQKLPDVIKVEIAEINEIDDIYLVVLNITYEEDLGYAEKVKLTLENNENKYEIIKVDEM